MRTTAGWKAFPTCAEAKSLSFKYQHKNRVAVDRLKFMWYDYWLQELFKLFEENKNQYFYTFLCSPISLCLCLDILNQDPGCRGIWFRDLLLHS